MLKACLLLQDRMGAISKNFESLAENGTIAIGRGGVPPLLSPAFGCGKALPQCPIRRLNELFHCHGYETQPADTTSTNLGISQHSRSIGMLKAMF